MAERRRNPRTKGGQASRQVALAERLRPWWPRLARSSLALVLLLGLAAVVHWARDPDTLPLREVQLEGSFAHLGQQELLAVVRPQVKGGFFNLDVGAVQAAAQSLAWVDRASVRRVWPDKVRIHVREQRPVAWWGEDALLNERGEVFAREGHEVRAALPRLSGPEGREPALLEQYRQLAQLVSASSLHIASLRQDPRRALELTLNTGVKVQLGRNDALARMRRFMRAYTSLVASREEQQLERVDLRYSNGFAVRWISPDGKQES